MNGDGTLEIVNRPLRRALIQVGNADAVIEIMVLNGFRLGYLTHHPLILAAIKQHLKVDIRGGNAAGANVGTKGQI